MDIKIFLNDKTIKSKEKTEFLSRAILDSTIEIDQLIEFAKVSKYPIKAICIEAFEYATKMKPEIAGTSLLDFVVISLTEKAPRIKWESARVIGNIAHLFPNELDTAIRNLLINSEHPGTVVRWSAAFALGQIIMLKTERNKELIQTAESIIAREEKNSIKKIYITAIKKACK